MYMPIHVCILLIFVNKLADAFQNKKYISIYIGIKYTVYYSIHEKIIMSGACGIRENLKKSTSDYQIG